jgi:hypothetical protein
MQIDKLVQLLESPVFIPIRLHLLDVNSKHHRNLLKSLYGLLMMLPQSQAYKTLSDRLSTVSSLKMHLSMYTTPAPTQNTSSTHTVTSSASSASAHQLLLSDLPPSSVPYGPLLQHFEEIQNKHNTFKLQIFQQQNKILSMPNLSVSSAASASASAVSGIQGQGAGQGAPGGGSMRSFSPENNGGNDQMIKSFSTSDSLEK